MQKIQDAHVFLDWVAQHSDEEEPEQQSAPDPVTDYTPAGQALKQKM